MDTKISLAKNIAVTAIIHSGVVLGENVVIEDFCIIGYPPNGAAPGEFETVIGAGSHIRSHTIIYAGVKMGCNCKVSHSVFVREHTEIGNDVSIGINCVVEHHCVLGDRVRLQGQAGLSEFTVIEEDAWVGPRTLTANVFHPTCEKAKICLGGPTIRKGAIIGGNVFISPDTEVGERAFVAAGSIVTKAVEPEAVVFGNPAKKVSSIDRMRCQFDLLKGSPYAQPAMDIPARRSIPLIDLAAQHQSIKLEVRLAMDRVIMNTRFIGGKELVEFEAAFARFQGVPYAVAVSNGTSAIELALRALNIGPGDEVITQANSFIATPEAISAVGATPVFVDVTDETNNIDPAKIEAAITGRTKALIPVHLYGELCPMEEIVAIAQRHGLRVIEDSAQAHGAERDGKRAGAWGDAATFSFYPGKNLGAYGDAGAVVTRDEALARHIAKLKDHGRSEKYVSDIIGGNERMDTLQAAILAVKLKYLNTWNEARRRVAQRYVELMDGLPLRLPKKTTADHVYHLFVVKTEKRDELQQHLKAAGIATGVHYPVPLHLQPALAHLGYGKGSFSITERLAREILSLPMYPEITDAQIEQVATEIRRFFEG